MQVKKFLHAAAVRRLEDSVIVTYGRAHWTIPRNRSSKQTLATVRVVLLQDGLSRLVLRVDYTQHHALVRYEQPTSLSAWRECGTKEGLDASRDEGVLQSELLPLAWL